MYDIISLVCPILKIIGYTFLVFIIITTIILLCIKAYNEGCVDVIKRYIRYVRICKALKICLLPWQKEFVLNDKPFSENAGRASGKTTAVLFRLVLDANKNTSEVDTIRILFNDKDFVLTYNSTLEYYQNRYNNMRKKCLDNGIKVQYIDFMDLKTVLRGD